MTHHCTKYQLENLGNYRGAGAECGLSGFEAGKVKKSKELLGIRPAAATENKVECALLPESSPG